MAPVKEPRIGPSLTRHDASKWVSSIRSIRSVPGSAERSTSGSMSAVHTASGAASNENSPVNRIAGSGWAAARAAAPSVSLRDRRGARAPLSTRAGRQNPGRDETAPGPVV